MDIIYVVIGLYNFIKVYLKNKEDIYSVSGDILDNNRDDSTILTIQSSLG